MTPLIHEDSRFTLGQADFCALPGYLVLRLKGPPRSLGELDLPSAEALGRLLWAAVAALERTTGAERVYLLTFAEVDPQFHVHLLPRTAWLGRAWAAANSATAGEPIDGPALFQWCRASYRDTADLPAEASRLDELLPPLREVLRGLLARAADNWHPQSENWPDSG